MSTTKQAPVPTRTLLALAVMGAFGIAQAQETPEIAQAASPGTYIGIGAGVASGSSRDRARWGMFNGLRDHDTNLLFDFGYRAHNDAAGVWTDVTGRNLTLDNRDASVVYRRFGNFKLKGEYSEITRHDPRTINTSLSGAGGTSPTVTMLATPGTGQDLNLQLKRKALSFAGDKWFGRSWQLEASFKNEDKDGSRLWGRGFGCSQYWVDAGVCNTTGGSGILMLPEPVHSNIKQAEARLNYLGEKLNVSFGYYGSFYSNSNGNLTPTIGVTAWGNQNGGTLTADPGLNAVLGTPMALPPDNQSHQLSVSGNYGLTHSMLLNFKAAYSHATQNEGFGGMGLAGAPGGRSDLGGALDTYRAQLGFSAHPLQKLHVHGDVLYDEKRNKTPLAYYNTEPVCIPPSVFGASRSCIPASGTQNRSFTNSGMSPKKYEGKLEASYQLAPSYTAVGGLKYEHEDFDTWTPTDAAGGVSALRQKLRTTGYRAELRKVMSETFNGSVAYERERRVGLSSWLKPSDFVASGGVTGVTEVSDAAIYSPTNIIPFVYMDRTRDKIRLLGNWTPMERLDLQAFYDLGKDTYSGPTQHGLRSFRMGTFSVDAAYTLTEAWKLTAYGSRGKQTVDQGHSNGYDAILNDTAWDFGFGVKGNPNPRWRVGADLTWIFDRLEYDQSADPAASAANKTFLATTGGLPDVVYRLQRLNVYGEYALQKNSYVRLNFVRNVSFVSDWAYGLNGTPFLYSDNTTISAQERQAVTFVGASYVFKFK